MILDMLHLFMIMKNNKIVYCQCIHVNDVIKKFKIKNTNAAYYLKIGKPSTNYP